jgi:hypothetical protein
MNTLRKYWLLLLLVALIGLGCEAGEDEIPAGYEIEALYEVKGKQRIDRTGEVTSCRMVDRWVFDFQKKELTTDAISYTCNSLILKHSHIKPFDTLYLPQWKGSYLVIHTNNVFGLNSPMVHKDFPLELVEHDSTRTNKPYKIFYRINKFDREGLVLWNKYDPAQIPRDTHFFELKMRYVEE